MSKKLLHRSDITKELVEKWIAEAGNASNAAKRHYNEIEDGRYLGRAGSYHAARQFIADVLSGGAPAQHILRNAADEQDLNRLRELLVASNVPVEHIGRIDKIRLSSEGVKLRQPDGSEVLTSKYRSGIIISPKWAEGPKWPVIQPASPVVIKYEPRTPVAKGAPRRIFLWPDTQIGFYRSVQTGKLTPFHDLRAIDVALQMLRAFKADEVVILGDFIDLAMLSRWLQLPEFQHTLQPALQWAYMLLAKIRSIVGPDAPIKYLAGNHERRLSEYIAKNAIAAHGIAPVEKDLDQVDPVTFTPKAWRWPVLSIPNLLEFEKLKIEYSAEYPGGEFWLNKRNVCTHPPEKVTKKDIRANVYHGHIPQVKELARTVHYHPDDGSSEFTVVAVAGLMNTGDVTDMVQLSRSATTSAGSRMNWQQAVATLLIFDDKHEKHEICRIKDGWGCMGDQQFFGNDDPLGLLHSKKDGHKK